MGDRLVFLTIMVPGERAFIFMTLADAKLVNGKKKAYIQIKKSFNIRASVEETEFTSISDFRNERR